VKNAFGILCQKFQNFAISILHNYLRDQKVGLSNIASSANVQTTLKIYKTKEEVPTKVLLK